MNQDTDPFDGHLTPGEVLRQLLDARSWTQDELAAIIGCTRQTIIQIMGGNSGISPPMAVALAAAFGNKPSDWLRLESAHQLSRVQAEVSDVERRARIYGKAPIRDMQRRGWIKDTRDVGELESELTRFYGIKTLDEQPSLAVSTRRSTLIDSLSPSQVAWCVRARQLASALQVSRFDSDRMSQAAVKLRELAAYRQEARHLPKVLASYGIRFVVVEPLPGSKIDGAAFWLAANKSPVVAVSIRYDRVDAFWFTVMHEFSHVQHGDAISVDTLGETGNETNTTGQHEIRANREAASILVPPYELESFMGRVAPLYSRQRIIQLAHRLEIHPAIIVGQLHHRGEIGYAALRGLLEKIRDVVTETALTDGWGKSISPGLL
jgi:HTH-type transcriptional regulator/antitoxin HigA